MKPETQPLTKDVFADSTASYIKSMMDHIFKININSDQKEQEKEESLDEDK